MTDAFDASNEDDVKAAERAARLRDRRDADVLRKLMMTDAGRAWLWQLLDDCHSFENSYTPAVSAEPMAVGWREGKRTIGLALLGQTMTASMDLYLTMWAENSPAYRRAVESGIVSRR